MAGTFSLVLDAHACRGHRGGLPRRVLVPTFAYLSGDERDWSDAPPSATSVPGAGQLRRPLLARGEPARSQGHELSLTSAGHPLLPHVLDRSRDLTSVSLPMI